MERAFVRGSSWSRLCGVLFLSTITEPASRDIENNKKCGNPPKYFDTDNLRKLSVSKEFWANDDPRRRSVLRVFTSKREVVFGMVLRQLHVNAFSPYSTYRRAMQVAVFQRKSGTPSRDKALQRRLRKLRLRNHADKLVAVHSWLMKRDVFLARDVALSCTALSDKKDILCHYSRAGIATLLPKSLARQRESKAKAKRFALFVEYSGVDKEGV